MDMEREEYCDSADADLWLSDDIYYDDAVEI